MGSVKLKDLKAFVRYDGSGRVVAGSLVFRKKKPKNGRWGEITKNLCCNPETNSSTTTTTTGVPDITTTTTTTEFIPSFYARYYSAGDTVLVYRDYDINPNTYYAYVAAMPNNKLYYSGMIGNGTQLYYDAAHTNPVAGNYTIGAASAPTDYNSDPNEIFYNVVDGIIVSTAGQTSTLAWNQFGNGMIQSRVQNDLVPCNDMYLNGFALAAGVTSIGIGVTVYNGANNPMTWGYLSYNGIRYTIVGSTVTASESC